MPLKPPLSTREQLARLLRLLVLLQSDRFPNVNRLAKACEVSRRTIFRDLQALRTAGYEVVFQPERQGYGLDPGRNGPAVPLSEREATALILLSESWGGRDRLGLLQHAREGLIKVAGGLPDDSRRRLAGLRDCLDDRAEPLDRTCSRGAVYEAILEAILKRVQIDLLYQDPKIAEVEEARVSPYRLVSTRSLWCLIGLSVPPNRVRLFEVPYIKEATPTQIPYPWDPDFHLSDFFSGTWIEDPEVEAKEVQLRFSRSVAPEILDVKWHPSQVVEVREDGRVELRAWIRGFDDLARWVVGFADQVEILAPESLRRRVLEVAQRLTRRLSTAGALSNFSMDPADEPPANYSTNRNADRFPSVGS